MWVARGNLEHVRDKPVDGCGRGWAEGWLGVVCVGKLAVCMWYPCLN